jgi:TRAP-type C4-dicarboxylate transport system permease large subunit
MKVFGKAAALIGAVTLMLVIIVAQRDYQRSWSAGAIAQSSSFNVTIPAAPERIARADR